MSNLFKRIADSDDFDRLTLTVILINAAMLGLDCHPVLSEQYFDIILYSLVFCHFYFIAEIVIRILGYAPNYGSYFKTFWNRFDFIIVGLSLLPAIGSLVTIARLFRILRVLRLLTVSDRMRAFLAHTKESLDEAFYFGIIWIVIFYVFAVSGCTLFSEVDPERWGTLWKSIITLSLLSLLQDVSAVIKGIAPNALSAAAFLILFFSSWIFLIINTMAAITAQHLESKNTGSKSDD